MPQKRRASHGEQRGEVSTKNMCDAEFIVTMGFLKKAEVPLKPVLALPFFNFLLHPRQIGGELKRLAITKPQIVIRFAFHQLHPFRFQGRVEVVERFAKQVGEKEKRRALVKPLDRSIRISQVESKLQNLVGGGE